MIWTNSELWLQSQLNPQQSYSEIEVELNHMYGKMEKLLDTMKELDEARPFLVPVTEEEAPDYHEVIKVLRASCRRH